MSKCTIEEFADEVIRELGRMHLDAKEDEINAGLFGEADGSEPVPYWRGKADGIRRAMQLVLNFKRNYENEER